MRRFNLIDETGKRVGEGAFFEPDGWAYKLDPGSLLGLQTRRPLDALQVEQSPERVSGFLVEWID
jgi:hypothetical protein